MNFRNDSWLIDFGQNLKKVREKMNYTQEKLAYESQLSLSQIARIETGKVNPTLCTIITIAKTLRVEPIDLFNLYFK